MKFQNITGIWIEAFYYSLTSVLIICTYTLYSEYSESKQAVCKLAVCCAACLQIGNNL